MAAPSTTRPIPAARDFSLRFATNDDLPADHLTLPAVFNRRLPGTPAWAYRTRS